MSRTRRVVVVATLVVAVAGVVMAVFLWRESLDVADQWGSVFSAVIGAASLVVSLASFAASSSSGPVATPDPSQPAPCSSSGSASRGPSSEPPSPGAVSFGQQLNVAGQAKIGVVVQGHRTRPKIAIHRGGRTSPQVDLGNPPQ